MQVNMTVEIQTALVERLKTALGNSAAENMIIAIVAESAQAEVVRLTQEKNQLIEANTRLNAENVEMRSALAAKINKVTQKN